MNYAKALKEKPAANRNPYVIRMIKRAHDYLDFMDSHKERVAKLEEKNKTGRLAPVDYQRQIEELKGEPREVLQLFNKDIDEILEEYGQRVNAWATLRAEELPADHALLTSGIVLTKADLEDISARYENNFTLQRALQDYAKQHQISFRHGPSAEKKTAAMADIAKFIRNVQSRGYNEAFMKKESAMSGYLSDFDNVIGDGSELPALPKTGDSTTAE